MALQENLVSVSAPIEDTEAPVSPKVEKMKMLRQVLIDSPCRRVKRKENKNWNSPGLNYSRKVLRSVIVSAIKEPYHDKYEKVRRLISGSELVFQLFIQFPSLIDPCTYAMQSMDKRSGILQKRPYLPERELCYQSVHSGTILFLDF